MRLCSTTLTFCWHSVHYDQRRKMGPTESTYLIWLYTILLQVVIERKSSIKVTFLTTCMHSCCVALGCSLDAVGSHCFVNLKSSVHLIQHKHYYYIDNILFCNSYLSLTILISFSYPFWRNRWTNFFLCSWNSLECCSLAGKVRSNLAASCTSCN